MWTPDKDAFIKANVGQLAMPIIAEQVGYSVAAVYLRLPKLGISPRPRKPDVIWSSEEVDTLMALYGRHPLRELPAYFDGKTADDLRTKAKSLGLASRKSRLKQHFREDFFSVPSMGACYWAGFIAADGYLCDTRGYVSLNIQERDRDHLSRFCAAVGFWAEPAHIHVKQKQRLILGRPCHARDLARVTVFSRRWLADLDQRFNIRPGKTYALLPPVLEESACALAYVAGLLDGDGFITLDSNPIVRLRTGIVGLPVVIDWVKATADAWLIANGHGESNPPRSVTRGPLHEWRLTGRQAYAFLSHLRHLDLPLLSRKWTKLTQFESKKEITHAAR